MELIRQMPFIVAILAGIFAQAIKVISFLVLEKKVNYRRFVQPDGTPNLHGTMFSALTISVGMAAGFDSIVFGLALCITSIVLVDTMNVKNATSRQAEAVDQLLVRLRGRKSTPNRTFSYTPIDVLSGVVVGGVFALFIYA